MPSQIELQNTILSAQVKMANLSNADRLFMQDGKIPKNDKKVNQLSRNINALYYQVYTFLDYTSSNTLKLYDCLKKLIGIDVTMVTRDPNYQAPNTTIIIDGGGSPAIPFNYTEADLIADTNGNYYLPFTLDAKYIPFFILINGVATSSPQLDDTFSPPRLYNFSSNAAQTIVLYVVSTTT